MQRNRSLLSPPLCNKWQTRKREMKWSWVARLFNIALQFSNILPTKSDWWELQNLLIWKSFTKNSYTEVGAPRLGCLISAQNAPQAWKFQVPPFFKLNAVSHVTVAYIYTFYIELICTDFHYCTTWPILATDTNPVQQSSFVVNKIISSGHHNSFYRCQVARAERYLHLCRVMKVIWHNLPSWCALPFLFKVFSVSSYQPCTKHDKEVPMSLLVKHTCHNEFRWFCNRINCESTVHYLRLQTNGVGNTNKSNLKEHTYQFLNNLL